MYLPNSKWTWLFFLVALVQAVIGLGLEAYVFARVEIALQWRKQGQGEDDARERSSLALTIPTYLSLFIFGFVYQIVLVYDALRLKNTIQIIGLCIYNVGIMVYAAIQIDQIRDTVGELDREGFVRPGGKLWPQIHATLIALPCVLALGTFLLSFIAWKLYDEFAWTIYKHISADLKMKKRYLTYQIYIALLKFDFFFFLAFTVQFLVIIQGTKDIEKYLTIAAIPITIVLLFLAAFWVRREVMSGMVCIVIVFIGSAAYFMFKLVRMYLDDPRVKDYLPARPMLTTFAILTLLLVVITIITACMCMHNFNHDLKRHLVRRRPDSPENKMFDSELPQYQKTPTNRMTID